jgi:HNH endonuclease/AP2 domain
MIEIPLTQGKVTLVDDIDYERLMKWTWHAARVRHSDVFYAKTTVGLASKGGQVTLRMHRVILNAPIGIEVDHRDRNPLNNQRSNLRLASTIEQARNRRRRTDNMSGFKGVHWYRHRSKWRSTIRIGGKLVLLGDFSTPIEAARAYNEAAREHFGDFCCLNDLGLYSSELKSMNVTLPSGSTS